MTTYLQQRGWIKLVLVAFLYSFCISETCKAEGKELAWTTDYAQYLSVQKKKKNPFFYTLQALTGAGRCMKMDKEILCHVNLSMEWE